MDHIYGNVCATEKEFRIDKTYTINTLISDFEDGDIKKPDMNRDGGQWAQKNQSLLIDSILRGFAIPPIAVMQKGTGDNAERILIDGVQRVSTVQRFKNNEFPLSRGLVPILIEEYVLTEKLDKDGKPIKELKPGKSRKTTVYIPKTDENGNKIVKWSEYKLTGKYYQDLPKSLQKRFDKYREMPMLIGVNCTEEEIREQMLRFNMGVKMNPAQIGTVICGEEVAKVMRSFRTHDLFKNASTWSDSEIKKDGQERCVVESYLLSYVPDSWRSSYNTMAEIFRENLTRECVEQYIDMCNRLAACIKKSDISVDLIDAKNLFLLIPTFNKFCEMDEYEDNCFSDFLAAWFKELKDNSEYNLFDKTSTKSKKMVVVRLEILEEEMMKYLNAHCNKKEEGYIQETLSDDLFDEADIATDATTDNTITDEDAIIIAALELTDVGFPGGMIDQVTVNKVKYIVSNMNEEERDDIITDCEFHAGLASKLLNENTDRDNEDFNNIINLAALSKVIKDFRDKGQYNRLEPSIEEWIIVTSTDKNDAFYDLVDNEMLARIRYMTEGIVRIYNEK